jgi:hypothetical protein
MYEDQVIVGENLETENRVGSGVYSRIGIRENSFFLNVVELTYLLYGAESFLRS